MREFPPITFWLLHEGRGLCSSRHRLSGEFPPMITGSSGRAKLLA
ncbi:hypothetical protein [Paracoccus caeni]|nr:hypothetical protein [Paracoccus caeni]